MMIEVELVSSPVAASGTVRGGDIKAVYNDIVAGSDENAKFWNREYKMNHAISEFPSPTSS